MKKIASNTFILLVLLTAGSPLQAQLEVGAAGTFGSEIGQPGGEARVTYGFDENWAAAASFSIFCPEGDELSTYLCILMLNALYNIPVGDGEGSIYPLAGASASIIEEKYEYEDNTPGGESYSFSNSETKLGVNVGVGGKYPINDRFTAFGEVKYILSDYDQAVLSLGVNYRIGE